MIKILTTKAFSAAIDVDEQGKILNAPKNFQKFIGQPFAFLEQVIRRNKFQSLTIEDTQEA